MKKIMFIVAICLFQIACFSGFAQNTKSVSAPKKVVSSPKNVTLNRDKTEPEDEMNKMMKMKVDYLKNNFVLKENQQKAFWDAYKAYARAEYVIHNDKKNKMHDLGVKEKMRTDSCLLDLKEENIVEVYKCRFDARKKLLTNEETFFNAMTKCLEPKQIVEYYILEKKFKKMMIHKKCEKGEQKNGIESKGVTPNTVKSRK